VPRDRWTGGDDYEAYVGRWSRKVAPRFIDGLSIPPGARWLDVGCGTGALTGAILEQAQPSSVLGVDPSADFVDVATRTQADPRARFAVADAAALPLGGGSVDVVVSGLVLNFVPDIAAALREMRRVAVSGGTVAAYVWDYAGRMDLIRRFFGAAIAVDPGAAAHDEGSRFPICSPGSLQDAFETAGLTAVDVHALDITTRFRDFDDYWAPFLTGVGAAPAYAASLGPDAQAAVRARLEATLPAAADGSIELIARAWAVQGRN
jgi:ubiquinone/menaquinone biosynthesis C-methylase UbiE